MNEEWIHRGTYHPYPYWGPPKKEVNKMTHNIATWYISTDKDKVTIQRSDWSPMPLTVKQAIEMRAALDLAIEHLRGSFIPITIKGE